MKRSAPPKRRKGIQRSAIKRKKRKPSEFARIYGSKARVEWVKSLPCIACVGFPSDSPVENAHTRTGGMGYKADYTTIVPLCHTHHDLYDNHQSLFANLEVREAIHERAIRIEEAWQTHIKAHS